ncbi:hypothetical protein K3169_08600 [Pseudomonas phytophila]|uniref:Lipoprotein n=1 Tax=Pseudomonas phytophila TaxID=2867264 RepID=A0ABY6FJ27_9PSED|nr:MULTISPECIES: hypothetical protein [Pseudomonas]MCD5970178.1 hypothetical protein [Pseudomonas quasicaspiana]MCQ3002686.1 hypothetical protein [Pseudomonas syringae]UXZ97924.1 hypothetical protein K3169_08600 [Pseudomonas phytophila]
MKRAILPAIILTALWVNVGYADNQSAASIPASGSPGTATPTPYPQVVPPGPALINGTQGDGALLPKVELPQPPKGQPVPGQDPNIPTPMPARPK